MRSGEIEIGGIWSDAKRLLAQLIKLQKHGPLPALIFG